MTDIKAIPTAEMLADYYASLLEARALDRLFAFDRKQVAERRAGNLQIMARIREELERRGELPDDLPTWEE